MYIVTDATGLALLHAVAKALVGQVKLMVGGAAVHAEPLNTLAKATANGMGAVAQTKNHLALAVLVDGEGQIALAAVMEIIQTAEEPDGSMQAHAEIAERFSLTVTDATTQDKLNVWVKVPAPLDKQEDAEMAAQKHAAETASGAVHALAKDALQARLKLKDAAAAAHRARHAKAIINGAHGAAVVEKVLALLDK